MDHILVKEIIISESHLTKIEKKLKSAIFVIDSPEYYHLNSYIQPSSYFSLQTLTINCSNFYIDFLIIIQS